MSSSNRGGSILSFLVIGGVLAALLVGGAYLVRLRSEGPASNPAPVAVEPAGQPSDQAEKKTPSATEEDKKVAVETKKEETPKESPQATTPPAAELPKTGPVETISSIIGAGLLSGTIVAYARSRRTTGVTL